MKINAIGPENYLGIQRNTVNKVSNVTEPTPKPQLALISFKGNPSKRPDQIAAYATESNFLGGIYKAGGLGDVAEALPEAIATHGEEVAGKAIDMRTFHPYYSFDNAEGKLYVAKKEAVERFKKGEALNRLDDFLLVDSNYKLKDGESFALITEAKDGKKIDRMFLLEEVGLNGQVERIAKDSFEMEKVPYRTFKINTNGARKDGMYVIHTYGIYQKYMNEASSSSIAYGGTAAQGGSTAYGGMSVPGNTERYFSGKQAGDMFYTEQMRAMGESLEKMGTEAHGKFNPQNIMLHDRFAYSMLSDATEKMSAGNEYWSGMRYVPIFHNPGRGYQGCYGNPVDFFKVVGTKADLEKLKANPHYDKINEISGKIAKGTATKEECTKLYNFFEPYFKKYLDSEGCFNMTKIAIATADEYSGNCVPGNVSRYYGKETRDFATEDIAKGLTQALKDIEDKTVDVVNGAKPANMATNKQDGFFGSGTLNNIFKDVNDPRKYTPFNSTDSADKILAAKNANKKNLINIIADATSQLENDKDAVAKVFFNDTKMNGIRYADKTLELTLGGLSHYKEGDILFLSWGRPDPQKGLKVTARAFRKFLENESIPLETRLHSKLLFGAGGGNDAFGKDHPEWKGIKEELEKIANIEAGGKKGIFKHNACYVNGLFPNRIANCADSAIFTSRFEPCGITPFESFATGTPVININSGGAPDFIKPGKTGILTKDAFMLSHDKLGLAKDVSAEVLDEARVENSAKQVAESIKEYLAPLEDGTFVEKQKKYIENCLKEKIEWHNNNSYNGGRSALDLYLHDRFRTQDNNVSINKGSSLRGEFNNKAFEVGKKGGKGWFNKLGKKGKIALGIGAGAAVVGGLSYALSKNKKPESEQKRNGHLSCVG